MRYMTPRTLWTSWSWDPQVLLCLGLLALCYLRGVTRLWQRAGTGRGVPRWRAACFGAGLLALFVALNSPLDALALSLVSAHMVQHLILIVVAAPLLVLGQPHTALLWSLPLDDRRAVGRWWRRSKICRPFWRLATAPLIVVCMHTVALWAWHLPALYQAAVTNEGIHTLEHLSFLGTALLLWWTLMHPGRVGHGFGVLLIFVTGMQSVALGALFTFAQSPWYPIYDGRTEAWGLTPLADQQLAGVIMWVPAGTVYLATAALLFMAWMRDMESAARRRESAMPTIGPRAMTTVIGQGDAMARRGV
jgi:putative membrane protein